MEQELFSVYWCDIPITKDSLCRARFFLSIRIGSDHPFLSFVLSFVYISYSGFAI